MKVKFRKRLRSITDLSQWVTVLVIISLIGCVSTGGYIKGQVLDADTRGPIPEADVAITWNGERFAFVETQRVCIHADATQTDADGEFRFLPWMRWDGVLPIADVQNDIVAYKPGYFDMFYYDLLHKTTITGRVGDPHLMKRFEGAGEAYLSREEYMNYLLQVNEWVSCGTDEANLVPILRTVYAEAEQFAQTESEKEKADIILYGLESYEFGSDEASRRHSERISAKKENKNPGRIIIEPGPSPSVNVLRKKPVQ